MTRRTWQWIWTAWLLAIIVSFAILEGIALNHEDGITLSRFVHEANQAWPLIAVLFGSLFGGLAVHFFWIWRPPHDKKPTRARAPVRKRKSRKR